ncbi:g9956 [Coccomyxa elongata]
MTASAGIRASQAPQRAIYWSSIRSRRVAQYRSRTSRLLRPSPRCPGHSRPTISCRTSAAAAPATLSDLDKQRVTDAVHQTVNHTVVSSPVEVQVQNGQITVGDRTTIIEGLATEAVVTSVSKEALVLGFELTDGAKSMADIILGKLRVVRFLACARCKLWWMTPEWGSRALDIPPETQFLLLEVEEGGPYAIALPLIDKHTFRGTLRGPKRLDGKKDKSAGDDEIVLRIESGDSSVKGEKWATALYIAADMDPFALVERAVAAAAAMSGGAKPLKEKQLPGLLDVFGWCTWDAFYSRVSARGLHEGLRSLIAGGVPPGFLIIDDGWQCTDVDEPLRHAVMQTMMKQLNMPEAEETSDEFIEAELEMLSMGAKGIPQGTALGAALETVAMNEDYLEHHYTRHERSRSSRAEDEVLPWRKQKRSRSKERRLESMSASLDDSVDASLDAAAADGSGPTASFVELSLDEDKIREILQADQAAGSGNQVKEVDGSSETNGSDAPRSGRSAIKDGLSNGTISDAPGKFNATEQESRDDVTMLDSTSPSGTSASTPGTSSTALSKDGEVKDAEIVKEDNSPYRPAMWLAMAVVNRVGGLAFGLLELLFVKFYQYIVDPAPADSWPFRLFLWLATGPFKQSMLEFYATSGDFTRRLTSIKANSKFSSPLAGPEDYYSGSPEQLGKVVDSLKQLYGLRYIYCWHGLSCYWSGVSPYEKELEKYKARLVFSEPTPGLVEIEPSMAWNPSVISGVGIVENAHHIYNDMHAYLAASGITGVKVDCQAGVGLAGSTLGGGPQAALQLNGALEDSVATHFPGNHCINCMCHSTENLYRMRDTAVVRVSDDFYPRNPASSYPHIAACAYNGFFLSAIAHPDWDMFHSKHPAAEAHAAARAVSGAAVYVSDYPGQHDFDLLKRLVLPGGGVLRASLPGRPTADCIFTDVLRDGMSVLKVWNANACNAVVGAFNLQGSSWDRSRRQYRIHLSKPPTLHTEVKVSDVPVFATLAAEHAAARQLPGGQDNGGNGHKAEQPAVPPSWVAVLSGEEELHRLRADEGIPLRLEAGGCRIVTIAPVVGHSGVHFAALGLMNMLNGGAAIRSCSLAPVQCLTNGSAGLWLGPPPKLPGGRSSSGSNGASAKARQAEVAALVTVHGTGRLLMFSSVEPSKCMLDGVPVEYEYENTSSRLVVTLPRSKGLDHNLAVLL